MISKISIMYDSVKNKDSQVLLGRMVEPFLYDIMGKYEDLYDDYKNRVITSQLCAFDINCESAKYPKGIPNGTVMKFANKKSLNLVKLTEDA